MALIAYFSGCLTACSGNDSDEFKKIADYGNWTFSSAGSDKPHGFFLTFQDLFSTHDTVDSNDLSFLCGDRERQPGAIEILLLPARSESFENMPSEVNVVLMAKGSQKDEWLVQQWWGSDVNLHENRSERVNTVVQFFENNQARGAGEVHLIFSRNQDRRSDKSENLLGLTIDLDDFTRGFEALKGHCAALK